MAIETRDDDTMPFIVMNQASSILLADLLNLVKISTNSGIVPSFSLKAGDLVTDSRMFANLVNHF